MNTLEPRDGYRVEFKIGRHDFNLISINPDDALELVNALEEKGIGYRIQKGTYYYHKGFSPLQIIGKDSLKR